MPPRAGGQRGGCGGGLRRGPAGRLDAHPREQAVDVGRADVPGHRVEPGGGRPGHRVAQGVAGRAAEGEPGGQRRHRGVAGPGGVAAERLGEPGPGDHPGTSTSTSPSAPRRDQHLARTPARCSRRAPAAGSRSPVAAASSSRLGLTTSGPAASAPRAARGPRCRPPSWAPPARAAATTRPQASAGGTAGGSCRRPPRPQGGGAQGVGPDGPRTPASRRGPTSGPGSLKTVASPSASDTTDTERRVSAAAAGEVVRDAARVEVGPHLLATQPAERPVATTCRPRWWSTEATLTPLPPASWVTSRTRWLACSSTLGTR